MDAHIYYICVFFYIKEFSANRFTAECLFDKFYSRRNNKFNNVFVFFFFERNNKNIINGLGKNIGQ